MKSTRYASLFLALSLAACDGATVPETQQTPAPVIPNLTRSKIGEMEKPSIMAMTMSSGGIPSGATLEECEEWVTEYDNYDPSTGNHESLRTCAVGGDIASIKTIKSGNSTDGTMLVTYTYRDGSSIGLAMTFNTNADGSLTQTGSASDGSSFELTYTPQPDGSVAMQGTYTTPEGTYVVDSLEYPDGRFSGTITFEDPATPESPDYVLVEVAEVDGTVTQTVTRAENGWTLEDSGTFHTDGSASWAFAYDDAATIVSPDLEGQFDYDVTGLGTGGYVQRDEDGGVLTVSVVLDPSGSRTETWTYADADPAVAIDQEGSASYAADGSGSGSYTIHLADGTSETCTFSVATDGTVTDSCA